MAVLLLVEDDNTLGMTLEVSLTSRGHQVHWSQNLANAKNLVLRHPPDLILLDLGLPDGDGLDFCREIRSRGDITPLLIMTARETLYDRVEGLEAGADDFLPKPFELPELTARVDALLRRQRWHGPGDNVRIGHLEVDFQRRESRHKGEPFEMTDLEIRLLRYFLDQAERVVSRQELLASVWDQSPTAKTRTVDVFVARLRRLIEEDTGNPRHILGVRGVGYRLLVEPDIDTLA